MTNPYVAPGYNQHALPSGIGYASIGRRVAAWLIDRLLVFILFAVLSASLSTGKPALLIYIVASAFLVSAYFVLLHLPSGRTPGKHLLRIQVLRTDGRKIALKTSLIRAFPYLISGTIACSKLITAIANAGPAWLQHFGIPGVARIDTSNTLLLIPVFIVFSGIELAFAQYSNRLQTLHDRAAGTIVIRYR